MQDLLTFIVEALVEQPDAVHVEVGERHGDPVLRIEVDPEDRGAIIGRGGRTIRAIETVLAEAGRGGPRPAVEIAD